MPDDHGTLRDDDGNAKVYLAIAEGGRPSVPLNESQVWPESLLLVNVMRNGRVVQELPKGRHRPQAEFFAERVEAHATKRLGLVPCSADHGACAAKCTACGAVR
jgi:hypothetical protein